jgi:hypothetical protein
MNTTAGSFSLLGSIVRDDAGIVKRLRTAGAVILGPSPFLCFYLATVAEGFSFKGKPIWQNGHGFVVSYLQGGPAAVCNAPLHTSQMLIPVVLPLAPVSLRRSGLLLLLSEQRRMAASRNLQVTTILLESSRPLDLHPAQEVCFPPLRRLCFHLGPNLTKKFSSRSLLY